MSADKAKVTHHHRRRLKGKPRHAAKLAEKLGDQLSKAHGGRAESNEIAKLAGQLQKTLADVRRSILRENAPNSHLVASGISDLSVAFQKFAQSKRTSDTEVAEQHLLEGKRALQNAVLQSQKAGDAWPL